MEDTLIRGRFVMMTMKIAMVCVGFVSANENHNNPHLDPYIQRVCAQTDFPRICETTIVPFLNGKNDPTDVLEMQLKAAIDEAQRAYKAANHPHPNASACDLKCYQSCMDTYNTSVESFSHALLLVQQKQSPQINTLLNPVNHAVKACDQCFIKADITRSSPPLHHYDEYIYKMNTNCLNLRLLAQPEG